MKTKRALPLLAAALLAAAPSVAQTTAADIKAPQPTVPQMMTLLGQYVRVAYNNEGFATLSYRIANASQGQEWMLLEAGLTVIRGTPGFDMKRDAISLKTPSGATVPLATQEEYAAAGFLPALNARLKTSRDPLNYFPIDAQHPCMMSFFNDMKPGSRQLAWGEVTLSYDRGCVGRLFFKVPGGIVPGQYWMVVQFPKSRVEVPFRILTKEEDALFRKEWQDFKKQYDAGIAGGKK